MFSTQILFYKINFFVLAWPISCKDLMDRIPASADLIILNFVSVGANFDFGTISLLVLLLLARPVSGLATCKYFKMFNLIKYLSCPTSALELDLGI